MGIPGLNNWFKRSFSETYEQLKNVRIDHLYVDMNGILHLELRKARNRHQFFVLLFHKCDFILTACHPTKSVMFALDGPAPLAKLLTQRVRRKKMTLSDSDKKGKTISPLALTPGTQFMQEVHEALAYYICQRLIGSKWKHLRMELSGATVQGEGETKMLARLQHPLDHIAPQDSHALIGNDADLLMMVLMTECKNVHVLGQILDCPSELPTSLGNLRVFSNARLKTPLLAYFKQKKSIVHNSRAALHAIQRDLALTCILSRGNDYLPSIGGLALTRDVDAFSSNRRENTLWQAYVKLRNCEEFATKSLVGDRNGRTVLDYEFLYHVLKESGINRIERKIAETQKAPEPEHYLDGINWLIDMYTTGACSDYRYVYDALGPSSEELCTAIVNRLSRRETSEYRRMQSSQIRLPLRPAECALALLPYQARKYVSKPLQHLMEPDSPIADLFEDCPQCLQFSADMAAMNKKKTALATQIAEIKESIDKQEPGSKLFQSLKARLEKIEKQNETIKDQIRLTQQLREEHANEKHPYRPFPIDRIEEAVRNVPSEKFGRTEHELFAFGHEYVFQRAPVPHRLRSAQTVTLRSPYTPDPPSEKFRRFKAPLPIVRTKYAKLPSMSRMLWTGGAQLLSWAKYLPR